MHVNSSYVNLAFLFFNRGKIVPSASLLKSFTLVIIAYISAIIVAIFTLNNLPEHWHILCQLLVADIAATVWIWLASRLVNNSSMYDAYWSIIPALIALWLVIHTPQSLDVREVLVFTLVFLWAARLTYNWAMGWTGLGHEDWRYVDMRKSSGKAFPLVDLMGIHMFPTLIVFLSCCCLWVVFYDAQRPFNWLDGLAFLVTFSAISIETIADRQMRDFSLTKQPGDIMTKGLWHYSRHPNYLGEFGFWLGLFLFGLAANPSIIWTGLGVLAMLLMFLFVSIPMLDKRSLQRRSDYQIEIDNRSAFFLWKPKL